MFKKIELIPLLVLSFGLFAQGPAQKSPFNLEKSLALQGYDPVTYFTLGKALKGKSSLLYTHQGIKYYFSSQATKELFIKNPAQYQPQYGGWCAYAMGENGQKVEIDPETFKIVNNKPYLFYNSFFNNTLKDWNKNEKSLKLQADKNWLNLVK
jgi:YHS domain-containing protein